MQLYYPPSNIRENTLINIQEIKRKKFKRERETYSERKK